MKKIGFIGVGIMGKSMVRNLMKHGYEVTIYTRTKSKVEDVIAEGAIWADTIATCADKKDAVISIVGYPKDVEEVYFSEGGILSSAQKGTYIIDMTTTNPKLSLRIYEDGKKKGLHPLDAPVTGGDIGAKNGTLTVFIGGEKEDAKACMPIFEAMGQNIVYQGLAGAGQHAKMANQIAIAGALSGVCEAFSYAKKQGLDPQVVYDGISVGSAGSTQMSQMAPRILAGNYQPGFFMKHFIKDMKIAAEESKESNLELPILEKVLSMYEQLEEEGKGDLGTQALIQYYEGNLS